MASVAQHVVGTFDGEPTHVLFDYDVNDPLVISLYFIDFDVVWGISRELFIDAVTMGSAGVGDVKISVFLNELTLHLSSPAGEAVVKFRTTDINSFIKLTDSMVKVNQEPIMPYIDDAIQRILSEAE